MSNAGAKQWAESRGVSRRAFLRQSVGFSTGAAAVAATSGLSGGGAVAATGGRIDPGYFASQFYDEAENTGVREVVETGSPFRFWGPRTPQKVKAFEDEFAKYMGTTYALGVTSGTAALDCAVAGLGIGPGDEVIVPAYTWWSDYTCVVHAGALPVFADIDRSLCLDPADFERRITPRTRAVIAVHLLGGPCDMDEILRIARARKIAVIEDAAQAVGATYRGKKLGSLGDVGIYSFQLNKMISSGEGGALVTRDPVIYERAVRFHDMGVFRGLFSDRTGQSRVPMFAGENFRMSEFTGAVLLAQLAKLDRMKAELKRAFLAVLDGVKDLPNIRFRRQPDPEGDLGYALYMEMNDRAGRDRCIAGLRERGVPAGTLSGSVLLPTEPSVVNKQTRHPDWPSFTSPEGRAIRYGRETCRQTLDIFDRFVQVRMGPKYSDADVARIIKAIREVFPQAYKA
ncbi:MAG: DegT/DnrJ/EryC1/StrS family aminotransferase [Candidatus Sumerlaeia bacterium]|nr:DegT/DnrJ/EryC1/StrS family aminotransferase [Candidatus Sumerlaeia bacterium]